MSERKIYRVVFVQQGEVYEVYARSVTQGSLFGFVEVETVLFGERTQVVVDPSEEKLKTEFAGVKRFHVPLHAVIRIDEVEKQGVARITQRATGEGNLAAFPSPLLSQPPKKPGKS